MVPDRSPDFIGVGSEKAATGWIYECLDDHPEICGSNPKETTFFLYDYKYQKGIDFYLKYFAHCPNEKIKGEISPGYLFSPKVPRRIYAHFPNIKIIICLREPVEKIYSVYRFHCKVKERLSIYKSFEDALKFDPDLIKRGFYYRQVKPYFDLFPRKNILVLFYEDIKKDQIAFIQNIFSFLGVKELDFIPPTIKKKVNATGAYEVGYKIPIINSLFFRIAAIMDYRKSKGLNQNFFINLFEKMPIKRLLGYLMIWNKKDIIEYTRIDSNKKFNVPPLSDETRKNLKKIYKSDIENLEELLDVNLNHWK